MRTRTRVTLILRRDDHIGDPIGTIFLDPDGTGEDGAVQRIQQYFGRNVRVIKLELGRTEVDVEVESLGLAEESARMTAAAIELRNKGGKRAAEAMLKEALKLDPLNRDAISALGFLLADRGQLDEALWILRRAREICGDDADILYMLAQVCLKLEKTPNAVDYLERAAEVAPNNTAVRSLLSSLGRVAPPVVRPEQRVKLIHGGRKA